METTQTTAAQPQPQELFRIAPLDVSDPSIEALVFSSWIKCAKDRNDQAWAEWHLRDVEKRGAAPVNNRVLCAGLHRQIERVLERAAVIGAVATGDPSLVLGFAVIEPHTLHWLSTKAAFRKHGIARALLAMSGLLRDADLVVTSRTDTWDHFAQHNGIRARFDPFALTDPK